jgi:hypothetical protein
MSFYGATLGETIMAGVTEGAKELQAKVVDGETRKKPGASP